MDLIQFGLKSYISMKDSHCGKRVPVLGTESLYRDLFDYVGPYSLFRVPVFGIWGKFVRRMSFHSACIRL